MVFVGNLKKIMNKTNDMMEQLTLNKQKNNIVQVYGMQRSGTNFLEWTLRYNFPDLNYDGSPWEVGEVPGDERYGMKQSLKHCLPRRDRGKALIIERDFEEWNKSIKDNFPKCKYTKEIYDFYYDTPFRENWHTDDYIMVNHRWAVENYKMLLEMIRVLSGGVDYKEDWEQPTKRVHFDCGTTLTDIDFKL